MSTVPPSVPPTPASTTNAGGSTATPSSAPPTTTSSTVTQQTQALPQAPLPDKLAIQLQLGQSIRAVASIPTSQQSANVTTLQTAFGPITVSGQNLPQANTPISLALALGGSGGAANLPFHSSPIGQLLQLTWQVSNNGAGQTLNQTAPPVQISASAPLTTNTLLGSQMTATTLTQSSVTHLTSLATGAQTATGNNIGNAGQSTHQSQAGQNNLAPNQNLTLRVSTVQLPGQTPMGQAPTASAGQLAPFQATVLASQPGTSIIQTTLGPMSIQLNQALPPGTMLTMLPLTDPVPIQQTNSNIAMHERWAGLKEAMSMIQVGNPQSAQQIMQSLPQPNNQMATNMMFLLSTLRGGALENWLGKGTAARVAGPSGDKLVESLRQGNRQVKDSGGQDWKVYGIPMQQDGDLGDLSLYLKDKPDDEDDSSLTDKGDAKRFVIETNFQKMGPLQLDGLATKDHIDLMFRSHIPVDRELKDEIRALFGNTITALGLTGTIKFHVADTFPVSFTEEKSNLGQSVTI